MISHQLFMFVTALLLLATSSSVSAADEPCDDLLLNRDVRIALKSVTQTAKGGSLGNFEIENVKVAPALELLGERLGNVFNLSVPDAYFEFKDPNGEWRSFNPNMIGSFLPRPSKLRIPMGKKRIFRMALPKDDLAINTSELRLALKVLEPNRCFVSRPFDVLPKRKSVQGYQSQ